MTKKNPHIGSSFEDFLAEEGLLEECTNAAIKRVVAWQVEQAMKERGLTKAAMAHEMNTSRAALNRLLDPENTSVTLNTLQRAAAVVGKRVQITLEDAQPKALATILNKLRHINGELVPPVYYSNPHILILLSL